MKRSVCGLSGMISSPPDPISTVQRIFRAHQHNPHNHKPSPPSQSGDLPVGGAPGPYRDRPWLIARPQHGTGANPAGLDYSTKCVTVWT
ncbi:hypothetical protein BaRGS_00025959 [Batillaria attramentaria]|uniref:Uncharacterized protein n=1 Tax=Batillaria attramentaria TaxID=370345 RepID=A0ABD0K6P9_9CAEN